MTTTGDQNADGGLAERVETLLGSLTAVVSARVVLDETAGAHVHIIATAEVRVRSRRQDGMAESRVRTVISAMDLRKRHSQRTK